MEEWTVKRKKLYPSISVNGALGLPNQLQKKLEGNHNLFHNKHNATAKMDILPHVLWVSTTTNTSSWTAGQYLIGLSVVGEVAIIFMEDFQLRPNYNNDFPEQNECAL